MYNYDARQTYDGPSTSAQANRNMQYIKTRNFMLRRVTLAESSETGVAMSFPGAHRGRPLVQTPCPLLELNFPTLAGARETEYEQYVLSSNYQSI